MGEKKSRNFPQGKQTQTKNSPRYPGADLIDNSYISILLQTDLTQLGHAVLFQDINHLTEHPSTANKVT